MIDWGWFYFITKPMFFLLDFIYKIVGNFGVAIIAITFLVKLVFFPLANRSYMSMAKMKSRAASTRGTEGEVSRRQDETAVGDDGDLQAGEDQSRSPAVCRW